MLKERIRPSFAALLQMLPDNDSLIIGVEIGVNKGENAIRMLEACDRLKLYLVDTKLQAEMIRAVKPFKERVTVINEPSVKAAEWFVSGFFNYIYIDAAHDFKNVDKDIRAWHSKLKEPGGMIAGHDYGQPGVTKAVNKFVKETDKHICTEHLDWWLKL